ncbi:MAG: hypothetical protein ACREQI_07510 [Candidatus Binataceae bacterium]
MRFWDSSALAAAFPAPIAAQAFLPRSNRSYTSYTTYAAGGDPPSLEFVTLDRRLAEAAIREGFPVLGSR